MDLLAQAPSVTVPLIDNINTFIINPIISLLFAVALIMFLWGVAQMIINSENEEARQNGRRHMIWGLFGLFIMVSVFGIMWIICNSIGCA